jgi:hypothetical protein
VVQLLHHPVLNILFSLVVVAVAGHRIKTSHLVVVVLVDTVVRLLVKQLVVVAQLNQH